MYLEKPKHLIIGMEVLAFPDIFLPLYIYRHSVYLSSKNNYEFRKSKSLQFILEGAIFHLVVEFFLILIKPDLAGDTLH
jgi:hypothetical protein